MKEISISGFGLSTMCRLCLSSGVTVSNLFSFSSSFDDLIANTVMTCAPVQIRSGDEMPKFICQKCFTYLGNTHQFRMQIIQSDEILQRYLEQLHAFDKKSKLECFIQRPCEDPLIDKINADIEKSECSKFDLNINWKEKEYENFSSDSNINIELSVKSETKDEQDNSIIPTDCADDTAEIFSKHGEESSVLKDVFDLNLNWTEKEENRFNSASKINIETSLKSEIKDEPMDGSLILTESIDDTVNDFSEGVNDITCEDTKVGFPYMSENSAFLRSSVVGDNFEKNGKRTKKTTMEREKYKKSIKAKPRHSLSLKTHKLTYNGDKCNYDVCNNKKPYQCEISGDLNKHRLIHAGEKPYQCEICKKCFIQSGNLSRHRLTHTGDKPYQCDICKKCFAQSNNLNSHRVLHTGEKPYQCDICKKCFAQASNLYTHRVLHTGEKPYQCDVCKMCFSKSYNLKRHKSTHSGVKD